MSRRSGPLLQDPLNEATAEAADLSFLGMEAAQKVVGAVREGAEKAAALFGAREEVRGPAAAPAPVPAPGRWAALDPCKAGCLPPPRSAALSHPAGGGAASPGAGPRPGPCRVAARPRPHPPRRRRGGPWRACQRCSACQRGGAHARGCAPRGGGGQDAAAPGRRRGPHGGGAHWWVVGWPTEAGMNSNRARGLRIGRVTWRRHAGRLSFGSSAGPPSWCLGSVQGRPCTWPRRPRGATGQRTTRLTTPCTTR